VLRTSPRWQPMTHWRRDGRPPAVRSNSMPLAAADLLDQPTMSAGHKVLGLALLVRVNHVCFRESIGDVGKITYAYHPVAYPL
jgi:hypothetical protein